MRRIAAWFFVSSTAVISASVSAQVTGPRTAVGCIALHDGKAGVTAKGRLTLRHMPGPPNFQSLRHGDEDRQSLILLLPVATCIDDGGNFADAKDKFRTVHVWSLDGAIHQRLSGAVGKLVVITGEGYARDNALQYAPLVLEAKKVTVLN